MLVDDADAIIYSDNKVLSNLPNMVDYTNMAVS